MLGENSISKKALVFIMIFMMLVGVVVPSMGVKADSTNRISNFIEMAQGKQTADMDLEDLDLTQDSLQFLGVYISNFYVPFGTELGSGSESSDDGKDVLTMNKEDIKSALSSNLSFSSDLAESLTETLIGLSRSNKQELKLYVSEKYQKNLVSLSGNGSSIPLNAYTANTCMLGGLKNLLKSYSKKNDAMNKVIDGKYKYGYFAYTNGSGVVPVFDFVIDGKKLSASAAAYIKCLESLEMSKGYGFNFFDFTSNEDSILEKNLKDKKDKLTAEEAYSMSAFGTKLYVDCFGDILFIGANHQFVGVPGCMNPYTWIAVNKNGKVRSSKYGGNVYNMINIPSLSMYEGGGKNKLFSNEVGYLDKYDGLEGIVDTKVFLSELREVQKKDGGISYGLRRSRGVSESKLSKWYKGWFGGETFYTVAEDAADKYKEVAKGSGDLGGSLSKSGVYVMGKAVDANQNQFSNKDNRTIHIFDTMSFIDQFGAFHFNDTENKPNFSTLNIMHYTSGDKDVVKKMRSAMKSYGSASDSGFTNKFSNITNGKMVLPSSTVPKEFILSIYTTYLASSLYPEGSEADTIGLLGYKMNRDALPTISNDPITISENAKSDKMLTSIRDWLYYLLHPTKGLEYFKIWLTNKINSFLLGWHDAMVGTNGTGSLTGTTKYRGSSGYVTTPELTDMPWTNSLLNLYNSAIPFLLIVMILIMLGAYVVGVLSLQRAVIGFVIFAICCTLPPIAINGAVGTANRFSTSLYGEKFTYWALVQHESYSSAIDEKADGNSYENYLKTLYAENAKTSSNQGGESIMLKWQAPKKMASLMFTDNDKSLLSDNVNQLFKAAFQSTYSGESYVDDSDSVYLYRSYIDIANFSRYIHRGLINKKQPINQSITSDMVTGWSDGLKTSVSNFSTKYEADREAGYANKNSDGSTTPSDSKVIRVKLPLSSKLVNEQLDNRGKIAEKGIDDYVGINQDAFQFSIPMFNVGMEGGMVFKNKKVEEESTETTDDSDTTTKDVFGGLATDNFDTSPYTNEDFSALAAYGLMSESSFYYFSWYLYETGLTEETDVTDGYKNLLLGEDNAGFFYNTEGNGEMKDFMDMRSLFTYIIPYLRDCNDLVREWDETYGIFTYDGVPTEEGHAEDPDIKNNKELRQKYWHNLNVARLYNMYSPWVDVMYDCSYAKPETIKALGEKYVIEDPLDPSSYPDERPMVFSKSEMADYGLEEKDLTKVEKLIIKCQEGMEERMFKLLNYHTFNDVVLNTAAAMNCAFEFNETFSENSIVGSNHNIYPQAFELKDFSYDAFLRFILSNSTGDSMTVDKDGNFYNNVVNNSSMTTIIVMLILDVLSMYVIPGFKIFFIVGIFLLAILIILSTAFRVDQQAKFVTKLVRSFALPILKFLGITCGMSLVVSWFMGEGNTEITGETGVSISLGDPVMVMLVMIALNCFVIFLYFKILRTMIKDMKREGKLVANFVGGVVGSIGNAITKGFSKVTGSDKGSGSSGAGGAGGKGSKGGSGSGGVSGVEEGQASPRAKKRGSSGNVMEKEKKRDNRIRTNMGVRKSGVNDREIKKKDSKPKSSADIESKTKKGMENIKSNSSKK